MMTNLHSQTDANLQALGKSLRSGSLASDITANKIKEIVGPGGRDVAGEILALCEEGLTGKHIALFIDAILAERASASSKRLSLELVLSGPELAGVPTRSTSATIQTLFEQAAREILLVGFAVQNAAKIFAPLAKEMAERSDIQVVFCLNIQRVKGDTSLDSEIVRRFAKAFYAKHWPWESKPKVYYDPRSLETDTAKRASLHAKCVVIDRKTALITSANFTEYAQERNIEVGALLHDAHVAGRIADYFETMIRMQQLLQLGRY